VIGLLVLCGGPVLAYQALRGSDSGTGSTGTGATSTRSSSPSPSVSPTPDAVSPDSYQQTLANLDHSAGPAFQAISGAHTPGAVQDAVKKLQESIFPAMNELRSLTAPAGVSSAHKDFLFALGAYYSSLTEVASAAGKRTVCAGSSALPRVTGSDQANQLRTTAQALGKADPAHAYKVGSFLPGASQEPNRRGGNGAVLKKTGKSGAGQLKIENGGQYDAVISMAPVNSKDAILMVYMHTGGSTTINGIRDGTYKIFMTSGSDWDSAAKVFTRDCDYQQFDDTFPYTTSSTYTIWTIKLKKVEGGNASTSDVDPGSIPG
jgi:hypothetical protein